MKEKYTIIKPCKLLSVSQGLTGKMAGMPAITSSMLCNEYCERLRSISGTVCEKCYTVVFNYFKMHKQPKNLSIVISSLLLNQPFDVQFLSETQLTNVKIFTVYTKTYAKGNNIPINCGKNRCIDCQRCYKKNKSPIYISEILK